MSLPVGRTILALALVTSFFLPGCSRRKGPSEAYARAHEQFSRLYAEKLDDAYLDPAMDGIEELLKQVPSNSSDAPYATELLNRIVENRRRMEKETTQRAQDAKRVLSAPNVSSAPPPKEEEPAAPETSDAGPEQPRLGMNLSEFQQKFSRCFEPGPSLLVVQVGQRPTWKLKNLAVCRELYPRYLQTLLIASEGKLWSRVETSQLQSRLPDGGLLPSDKEQSPAAAPGAQ